MGRDPRVDEYIGAAADFARPVLQHLRGIVHAALPDADEAMKWGVPRFIVNGKNVAGMAAFKAHCTFIIHGESRQGDNREGEAMGQFGRLRTVCDLPSEASLRDRLTTAAEGVRSPSGVQRPMRAPKAAIPVPEDFAAALGENSAAQRNLDGFAPSYRRDYLEWITEAKTAATRSRRIAQAVEWLSEGKRRNWKYERG